MEEKTKVKFSDKIDALKLVMGWTFKASPLMFFLIVLITILGGLIAIIEPYLFKLILDKIISSDGSTPNLASAFAIGIGGILIVYAIARITQSIFWDAQNVIKRVYGQVIDKEAALFMMDKISSLDATYFENPEYHTTLSKANDALWRANEFFWQSTFLFGQLVSIIVIIGTLISFSPLVVLLVILGTMPSIILAFKTTDVVWNAFDVYSPIRKEAGYYRRIMTERQDAIKEIRLFGLQTHFLEKFRLLVNQFVAKQKKAAIKETSLLVLMGIIEGIFSLIAAWIVIKSFIAQEISIGTLTFLWALLFQFAGTTRWAVRMIGEINETATFVTPLAKVSKFRPMIIEVENAKEFPEKLSIGIEFKNVSFKYPGSNSYALKKASFTIKSGESIALVGENGCGKTTLVKLLTRLYDVTEGEILIDGINIKNYSIESLHKNIGIIFQDFMKYEALVEENISYGDIGRKQRSANVQDSAKKSGASEFIKDLESEYKTHLGKTLKDKGTELSVGQWQKIALARAFFKDAPILILDEPTAAVDAKAEYELFKKFESLTKGKTTFLISHRFSTVRMASKIIVMDKGRIIEQGNHQELLRKQGQYAKLFTLQAKGYQ
ncbi:MAG: ABC transporter ATP-binding protein [Nanoarchaeota archaeon]